MTRLFRALAGLVLLAVIAGCGAPDSKFKTYNGPPVTQIVVQKSQRKMFLLSGNTVLKAYDVGLGYEPDGPKMFSGDGRTPEGTYFIDRRNPNSQYHLSLGISYPTPADIQRAASFGLPAGGDIFIHGQGPEGKAASKRKVRDWTAGCIAVTDKEIEEIFSMVGTGVPITIQP